MDEYIKEFPSQKVIGVLRTSSNGDIYAYAFPSFQALGVYKPSQNGTYEIPSYRRVSDGNTVIQFIYTHR